MNAYPVLRVDTFTHPDTPGAEQWQAAMTYKFVGALKSITDPQPHVMVALKLGVTIGVVSELIRKILKSRRRYQAFVQSGKTGYVTDFLLDAIIIPSPYASSFGGFFNLPTTVWFATGGTVGSLLDSISQYVQSRRPKPAGPEVPADMSTVSLIGGGLIAGESLAALGLGIFGLLKTVLK
jgi:hypothetical protein